MAAPRSADCNECFTFCPFSFKDSLRVPGPHPSLECWQLTFSELILICSSACSCIRCGLKRSSAKSIKELLLLGPKVV
eukprot:1830998-Pyramimonas_sp.AAC.1